ncbi:GNAT family N-acetyltransferase [Flagellimonas sp.]|uniref:GNAT family N-acetyltransferase n=1 Tax=Flagellimonas sp. TaxID=2058762 RepID=UPI003BAFC470
MKKESVSLFTDLYIKQGSISQVYSHIGLSDRQDNNLIHHSNTPVKDKKIYSFSHVPDHLKIKVFDSEGMTERMFPTVKGHAIRLEGYSSADAYLRHQNKKQRENINRARRRLESCFDIQYKLFHHQIEETDYEFLMERLRSMIVQRFEQRGQKSSTLAIWDKVYATSFDLINQGKASLFVVYDKDLPIAFSFNYIYDRLLFGYISSYDLDYGKFSLGQIVIYKLLEWCMDNEFIQYDMGWGDLDYKKWWCNTSYRFNHHFYYPKYSIKGFLHAQFKGNRSRILAFLIAKGVNTQVNKIKRKLKGQPMKPHLGPQYRFMDVDSSKTRALDEIKMHHEQLPFSKKVINDFLFATQEHSDHVSLYYSANKDHYILKGQTKTKSILFNPTNH